MFIFKKDFIEVINEVKEVLSNDNKKCVLKIQHFLFGSKTNFDFNADSDTSSRWRFDETSNLPDIVVRTDEGLIATLYRKIVNLEKEVAELKNNKK